MPSPWTIPKRNPLFTGREDILNRIHSARYKRIALVGARGIGKTEIALEYVCRHRDSYQAVFWVYASKEMSADDFLILATQLQASSGWLLVVDQVEDPTLVERIVPKESSNGHILVTSCTIIPETFLLIPIPVFSDEEAALFLLRSRGVLAPDEILDQTAVTAQWYAIDIARLLEGVPVALDLAAKQMKAVPMGLLEYRDEVYQKKYGIPLLKPLINDTLAIDKHVVYFEGSFPDIYVGRMKEVKHYEWGEMMEDGQIVLADVTLLKADNYHYLERLFYHTYLQQKTVIPASDVFYPWPDTFPPLKFEKQKWPGHEKKIRLKLQKINIIMTSSADFVDHEKDS